jgi:hypothetical protein
VLVRNPFNVSYAAYLNRVSILSYLGAFLHFPEDLRASDSSRGSMLV